MSILTYNGVILPYANCTQFSQEAVDDEESHTDWYCTKFDITVQSVIHYDYLATLCAGNSNLVALLSVSPPPTVADLMKAVRVELLRRRRTLSFTFNGVQLIAQPQSGLPGSVDAKNGPMPQSCTVTALTNTSFIVTYRVVAHYWENNTLDTTNTPPAAGRNTNNPGNAVLFNRWTERVEMDSRMYSRRSRQGKYAIRSDNSQGLTADQLRNSFATVGVSNGFLRDSSNYTLTPDGLAIQYNVVDREVFKMPPAPAYEAEGEYTEFYNRGGAIRFGEVRVKLKGAVFTPQADLLTACVNVAVNKILLGQIGATVRTQGALRSATDAVSVLEKGSIRVSLYDNEVEVRITVMFAPTGVQAGTLSSPTVGWSPGVTQQAPDQNTGTAAPIISPLQRFQGIAGVRAGALVYTPGSDNNTQRTPPAYLPYGSAGILLQAAAYYDPSLTSNSLNPNTWQMAAGILPGQAGQAREPLPPPGT
jgi:hypothetical protein